MPSYLNSSWSYGGDIGITSNKTQVLRDIEAPTSFGLSKSSLWRSRSQSKACTYHKPTWLEFQSQLLSQGDFDVKSPLVFQAWQGIMDVGYKPSYTEEAIQYVIRELTYTPQRISEAEESADGVDQLDRRAHGLYAADNFQWSEGLFGEDVDSSQLQRNLQVGMD